MKLIIGTLGNERGNIHGEQKITFENGKQAFNNVQSSKLQGQSGDRAEMPQEKTDINATKFSSNISHTPLQ